MTAHLPVLNDRSHASTTAFCVAEVRNPDDPDRVLFVDGNGKITRDGGNYAEPAPNAFSLVHKEDCPGSTPTCRSKCYVENLKTARGDVYSLYQSNSRIMREVLADGAGPFLGASWALALARWIRANTTTFRWHVSGDLFSRAYAAWVASVVELAPGTDFWIYTRSLEYVPQLAMLRNLSINLSADQDNYERARAELKLWDGTVTGRRMRLAYMTVTGEVPDDLPPGSITFPDYALRGAKHDDPVEQRAASAWWQSLNSDQRRSVCPADFYGTSDGNRCGPCGRCL